MEFKLKSPCNNCPFLKSPYFYLRPEFREEIAESLLHDKSFPCHKTVNYENFDTVENEEGEEEQVYDPSGKEQHCAGALIVMVKGRELWDNFLFRLSHLANLFDPGKLDMSANVYDSLEEFVADQRRDDRHVETKRKGSRQASA